MKDNFNGIIDRETFETLNKNVKWKAYFKQAIANTCDKGIPLREKRLMGPYYTHITGDETPFCCDRFIIYRLAYWFFESEKHYAMLDSIQNQEQVNKFSKQTLNEKQNEKTAENKSPKQRAKRGTREV